jgi:hypothetical protein
MTYKASGPFIIVTKTGHVFGATSVEATESDLIVRLKGLQHRIGTEDIAVVYCIDSAHPAARIDPGILSAVTALEGLMAEFSGGNLPPVITIFGSGSLALALLTDRSTNDLDTLVSDEFAAFVNRKHILTDIEIELLDESLLKLLGPWTDRTSELIGPLGLKFRLVHPFDTVMQKLLRFSVEHFVGKDQGDIDAVLTSLQPTKETLLDLLTENPARYARLSGRFASQADAIERNTRWFLGAYLPETSFEDIVRQTGDRAVAPALAAGLLPKIPPVDLRSFVKPQQGIQAP